jgi:hypothetical protein
VLKKFRREACSQALVLGMAAALLVPAAAQATPTFLSPVTVSDAGQDAYEPQIAQDSSNNSLMVWTRSDGTNLRIQAKLRAADGTWGLTTTISQSGRDAFEPQLAIDPSGNAIAVWTQFDGANGRVHAAFRPAGGSFGGDQTISPGGGTASAPQISIDSNGKAVAVWYRFEGATDRIQAAVRPVGGTFGAAVTLSDPSIEAFEPQVVAGPNADANAAVVWTGSDGTNLRVQASRRRDVVGFPRPKGATPVRVSLVPAYNACTSANRTHGPGLVFPSCTPPVRSSSTLTVGTPDAYAGTAANSTSSVRFRALVGNASTTADEADVDLTVAVNDVRNHPALTDYAGSVMVSVNLRVTDNQNASEQPEPGTMQDFPFRFAVQCVTNADTTRGSDCNLATTADALIPAAVTEAKRSIWEMGDVIVRDAGPNGTGLAACPPTCGDGDETVYMRQGIFVP